MPTAFWQTETKTFGAASPNPGALLRDRQM
jgi:hypothetical protein